MLPRHLTDPTAQRVTRDGTRCTVDVASDLRNAGVGAAPSQTRATGADKATAKRRHGGVHTDAFPRLGRVSAMRPRWRRRLGHSEVILYQKRAQHGVQEVSATASVDTVSETNTARRATRFSVYVATLTIRQASEFPPVAPSRPVGKFRACATHASADAQA